MIPRAWWSSTSTCITQYNRQNQTCTSIYDKGFSKGKLYAINCAAATSNGTLYFGGSGGITVVYPDKPIEEVPNIPMNFDAVLVNGNMRTDNNGMLSLNHRENMITFWYSSLNFEYGSSLNYAYKLEGFDKDWIDAGTNKRVAYSNLPAGNYTFKVKVRKLNGEWSKNELKMDVCIHPAPWATPWAIAAYWLLGVLLTGGLIAILVRWKVQQERLALAERQKEMNQELLKEHFKEMPQKSPYYLGILSCIRKNDSFDLIDGQQRFTVIMLLGIVLREYDSRWKEFIEEFDGMLAALIVKNDFKMLPFISFFLAALKSGALGMERYTGIPKSLVDTIIAIFIIFATMEILISFVNKLKNKKAKKLEA